MKVYFAGDLSPNQCPPFGGLCVNQRNADFSKRLFFDQVFLKAWLGVQLIFVFHSLQSGGNDDQFEQKQEKR
jgi:hypothetical protein